MLLGSSCVRLNQSATRPRIQQEATMKNEQKNIYDKVHAHLVAPPHQIPGNNAIFKKYSTHLGVQLERSYRAPICRRDQILAHQQANIAQSIRAKMRQHNLVLRVVDKGSNFYIGSAETFERKVQKYFTDTNAFVQLSANPFNDILNRVTQSLRTLASKKLILQWQLKMMLPDPKTSELSYLYFNPKTHKVSRNRFVFFPCGLEGCIHFFSNCRMAYQFDPYRIRFEHRPHRFPDFWIA